MDRFKQRYMYKIDLDKELRRSMAECPDQCTPEQAIAVLQPCVAEHLSFSCVPPNRPPNTRIVMGDSLGSAAIAFQWAAEQAHSSAFA
mmetsp:Transcript_2132/g.4442  ORF Transcript_2132/g.4442 Transcript_2132/m.4442 type:complete len:88 (-) Transcript_2132:53-316(-)